MKTRITLFRGAGLEHANTLLEDKVAHLHDQTEFWEEEGKKLKAQLEASEAEGEKKWGGF